MADPPAIGEIADAIEKIQAGSGKDVRSFLESLNAACNKVNAASSTSASSSSSSSGSSSTWFTTQPNNVTFQGVGSGAAQVFAPSFSAIKADETGISILGRKVFDFPFPKLVDKVMGKSEDPMITDMREKLIGDLNGRKVAETFGALGTMNVAGHLSAIDNRIGDIGFGKSVAATFGMLGSMNVSGHIDSLGNRIKAIENLRTSGRTKGLTDEQKLRTEMDKNRDQGRIKGAPYEYNKAQIDSLERSIKLLAEAIGI